MFNPPPDHAESHGLGDTIVQRLLGGFRRWDAIYFLFIAKNGYAYENTLAFFPLYPLLVNQTAAFAHNIIPITLNFDNWLLLCGSLLNVLFFVKAAQALFQWTQLVGNGQYRSVGYAAVVAFAFNPASIFFSACYSESLFCYLTFRAFTFLEKKPVSPVNQLSAVSLIAFSGATRSNGLVSLGVYGIKQAQRAWKLLEFRKEKQANQSIKASVNEANQSINALVTSSGHINSPLSRKPIHRSSPLPAPNVSAHVPSSHWPAVKILLSTAFFGLLGVMPFALFQLHGYSLFCRPFTDGKLAAPLVDYANERGYIYLDPRRGISQWCKNVLPLAYSHVQASHWDVGLFQYYQVKQIPNFVLALPIVVLSLWSLWRLFIWGGRKLDEALLPYGIHLAFMLTFCVFFIHIQVHLHSTD